MALLISILKKVPCFSLSPSDLKHAGDPLLRHPPAGSGLGSEQTSHGILLQRLWMRTQPCFSIHRCFSSSFPLWLFHLLSSVVKLVRAIGPNKRSNSRTAPHHAHLLLRHCVILSVFCPTAFSFLWLFVFKTIYFLKYWWPYNVYNFNLNP